MPVAGGWPWRADVGKLGAIGRIRLTGDVASHRAGLRLSPRSRGSARLRSDRLIDIGE
ncbi:MAG: hypothetical protein IPK27_21355 [Rhodanobacteraceae bacterium]|nr:hypothetical protein [Rhodanobacteraceae bacterium]